MVEDKEMELSVDESARTQTRSHEAPGHLESEMVALVERLVREARLPPARTRSKHITYPAQTLRDLQDLLARIDERDADQERCMACAEPMREGEPYLPEADGGIIHAACCGPEREGYFKGDGEPLEPDDPIPTGSPWHGTTERPNQPWEAEKASLQSEIEALRGERDAALQSMACWADMADEAHGRAEKLRQQLVSRLDVSDKWKARALAAEASLAEARGALAAFAAAGREWLGPDTERVLTTLSGFVVHIGHLREAARVFSALPSVSEGVGVIDHEQ